MALLLRRHSLSYLDKFPTPDQRLLDIFFVAAKLISFYFERPMAIEVSPTSYVSTKAALGTNVKVGHFTVIHDNVVIEDGVTIGDHCSIGIPTSAKVPERTLRPSFSYTVDFYPSEYPSYSASSSTGTRITSRLQPTQRPLRRRHSGAPLELVAALWILAQLSRRRVAKALLLRLRSGGCGLMFNGCLADMPNGKPSEASRE